MNPLPLIIGIIASLSGIAIVTLTMIFLRAHRAKNVVTGIALLLIGVALIWLTGQENMVFQLNIGVSDQQFSIILAGFVLSLFFLKGILDIREGSRSLKQSKISATEIFRGRLQILAAVGVTSVVVLALLMLIATR